jgi:hypothetical protein
VNNFLDLIRTPRGTAKIVKTIIALDAMTIIQIFLEKFGLVKFLNYVFWFGLFI